MGRERQNRNGVGGGSARVAEPNMTPLIDLTFLLLITFIITFPMLEQGISIKLPKGKAENIEQSKSQSITINVNGELFFNNRQIAPADLEGELSAIAAQEPQPPVLIRCDERVEYGDLARILRIVNKCKISRMALVQEPGE